MKRVVAIFTGNRAEYGLQKPIIHAIKNHPNLEYRLIVSGAHLDVNFGNTIKEIEKDGFEVFAEAKISPIEMSRTFTSQSIACVIQEVSKILTTLNPDFMVVYADRFEGFGALVASTQMNIPTAHIEGGDLTEGGALDDSIRHAMTKLAHLHFATNSESARRILALGEEPWRVHTVGFPAIDLIMEGDYASASEVETQLGLNLAKPIVLFTQHSVTTEPGDSENQLETSILALLELLEQGVQVVITYPNNDYGSEVMIKRIRELTDREGGNLLIRPSLGRFLYHGVLALARDTQVKVACVGNSSSGIKETPAFHCPTVNIGSRQEGRLRGDNVIDVDYDVESIVRATLSCLFDDEFRAKCRNGVNPYYLGGASNLIAQTLADIPIDRDLLRKRMTV
jgi:UDP-N-acetylglucosamine 2-epimerase (non-hydrolysing)/GDP/UDP-N,N'-diacetylbacillosamine 2-epimerase (hydrolysing)